MKSSDEIKKALFVCSDPEGNCPYCPYAVNRKIDPEGMCAKQLVNDVLALIEQLEKDAQNYDAVVRCKDCKHHDLAPALNGTVYCTCWDAVVKEDGFCYEGKRMHAGAGCVKDRINQILEIMAEFNEANDDCDQCPFYDAQCSGDSDKACLVQDLTDILRIVVQKDVLNDDDV